MISKKFIVAAGASGAVAVGLGALGAHSVKPLITAAQMEIFHTALTYQIIHSIALLALAPNWDHYKQKSFQFAGMFWIAGIILFSGSLYLHSLKEVLNIDHILWFHFIAPFGGLSFILGWLFVVIGALKIPKSQG
jgi:uncharacterized membrane protein YgdD (TMEM256/DUF423 family)